MIISSRDIADAIRSLLEKRAGYQTPAHPIAKANDETQLKLIAPENESSEFYLRLHVKDIPGGLSQVSGILSDAEISIANMIQHEEPGSQSALILLTTHETSETSMQEVLKQFQGFDGILEQPLCMRILGQLLTSDYFCILLRNRYRISFHGIKVTDELY